MKTAGLKDMLAHFLQQHHPWYRDGRAWSMVRVGREVRSRTDYILGKNCCLFRNVAVRAPRHNLEHYLVLGCLLSTPLREHTDYLGRRKRLPLHPPTTLTREDRLFKDLQRATTKLKT